MKTFIIITAIYQSCNIYKFFSLDPKPWLHLPSDVNELKTEVKEFQGKFPFALNVHLIGNAGSD